MMKIWIDGDACPVAIKEILFRAAERTGVELIIVANQPMRIPKSRLFSFILVSPGFDAADEEIVKRMSSGDLVITADIPLAADAIARGGFVLNPRGELYTADNIKARLSTRDFLETLRSGGIETGGPSAFSQKDRRNFANELDKILIRNSKNEKMQGMDIL